MIGFPPRFFIKFRRFFIDWAPGFLSLFSHQVEEVFSPIKHTQFPPQFLTRFRSFSLLSHDLKCLHACLNSRLRRKVIVISWSHMTNHVIDLTWSGQFHIITHPASRGWLCHQWFDLPNLPNQTSDFRINLSNQHFKSTYIINLLIELAAPLAYSTLLFLTNVGM